MGVWGEGAVALGHARLRVIDLSNAASQPMFSADGRYIVVFNGEIYNHRELRAELDDGNTQWRSRSDTEVILRAYSRWGAECLSRFRGMFAFAIWDRAGKRLFAARDRFGVKPFYYSAIDGRFSFASRPKALLALALDPRPALDPQAVRLYLEAGYIPAPWTLYSGVRKLRPGHYLVWSNGHCEEHSWWSAIDIAQDSSMGQRDTDDLVDELEQLVGQAVRYRLESDVPLGAFLSGGIDSSIVVAMMRRFSTGSISTFSIGFNEPEFDEAPYAKAVAEHLGCDHQTEQLTDSDFLGLIPKFRDACDEPLSDAAVFPTLAVARLARSSVTVALSGDGGDELFGGYHYYRLANTLNATLRLPEALRRTLASMARLLPAHKAKLLAGALLARDEAALYAYLRGIQKDFDAPLTPEIYAKTIGLADMMRLTLESVSKISAPAERASRLDIIHLLPEDYLQKVDTASMAWSLEVREPLLDHELGEWAMRLPWHFKQQRGEGKVLLRQLACRLLPRELIDRPKRGFSVPLDRWLRRELRDWAQERIEATEIFERLPLDQERVRALFSLHLSGRRNIQPLLWAILVLIDFVSVGETH